MYSIYSALTSTDNTTEGIKGLTIFYDTLFLNIKSAASGQYIDNVLIEKLKFDYDTNHIESNSNGHLISFGNTQTPIPFSSNGNTFVDNLLFENKKTVLVCGLSSSTNTLTATVGSQTISGNTFLPIIYQYSINDDALSQIYPQTTDMSGWSSVIMGTYLSGQTPLVSFNSSNQTVNFIVKSRIEVISPSARTLDIVNDIMFNYNYDNVSLTNVRQLSAVRVNDAFVDFDYVKFKNHGNNKKLIISRKNDAVQLFTLL